MLLKKENGVTLIALAVTIIVLCENNHRVM